MANEVVITMYGVFMPDGFEGEDAITPLKAQELLNSLDKSVNRIHIYGNSPGGNVFAGITIANMFKRFNAEKVGYVDGVMGSIASYFLEYACDRVVMPTNAYLMIHYASVHGYGNKFKLRELAEELEKLDSTIIDGYVGKCGDKATKEEICDMMEKETWLSADEALRLGFCDEISEANKAVAFVDIDKLKEYQNTPTDLINSANITKAENIELYNRKRALELKLRLV